MAMWANIRSGNGKLRNAQVGSRVFVLDPSLAKLVEPTGTIVEVRCDGGRVKVEHDGALPRSKGGASYLQITMSRIWCHGSLHIPKWSLCNRRCRESGTLLQHWQGWRIPAAGFQLFNHFPTPIDPP